MDTNRWTRRLHTPERDATAAAERSRQALELMLEESLRLDAEQWPPLRAVSAG